MISNYWKDNQKQQYASDYPYWKKQEEAYKKELQEWKDFYIDMVNKKEEEIKQLKDKCTRLEELSADLTCKLQEKDLEVKSLLNKIEIDSEYWKGKVK